MPPPNFRLVQNEGAAISPLLLTSLLSPPRLLRLVAVLAGVISVPMALPMLLWALAMLVLVVVMRR